MKKQTKRQTAIQNGVSNAVDTVVIDKAMSRDLAYSCLKSFVSSSLADAGLDDQVSEADMKFAKSCWPL